MNIEMPDIHLKYSAFDKRRVEFDRSRVWFLGVDTGKTTLIRREGDKVVFKINGHNHWAGIGTQAYAHPKYLIGFLVGDVFYSAGEVVYDRRTGNKAGKIVWKIFDTMRMDGDEVIVPELKGENPNGN